MRRRGQPICVLLAGGDQCVRHRSHAARHVAPAEMTIVPALRPSAGLRPSGLAGDGVEMVSLCGRDPGFLDAVLYQGRVLVLSAGSRRGTRRRATDPTRLWKQLLTVLDAWGAHMSGW
jgi:hypothetical protein